MFKAIPLSAHWSESCNAVLTVEITLPQKEISKPDAFRICGQIEALLHLCMKRANSKPIFTRALYMDFVATLQSEGEVDIASEEQWRAELEADYAKGEI